MKYEVGIRVGAMECVENNICKLYGYGVYEGDCEIEISDFDDDDFKIKVPKIKLDNGEVVYGYQCWWGPEEIFNKKIEGLQIEIVKVPKSSL